MNKSEQFWDKTASQYDQIEQKDQQTYLQLIERTKSHLNTSDVLLDYGCGTGLIANEIATDVKTIHAIDISSNMIAIATAKANDRNLTNINYAHAVIFDKRYTKGSFDVILAFHVLHLLEDEHIVLQRINDLLKPGGLLISATPCVGEKLLLGRFLSFAGKIGVMPHIKSFKVPHLVETIEKGNFSIVEADYLKKSSQEYFIVARKH
ncbi:class I SAM-dependent methyltransferase [Paenibacillus gorillae]|uniref:class I SAM-dependent methyltransferase n=1 Tax=Paenibacillus gorillae TaxID=1243662 RepID=UPI0004BBFFC9|nr:class I SAM-dependent methyltransferase [Paenibacillus gorillae]